MHIGAIVPLYALVCFIWTAVGQTESPS